MLVTCFFQAEVDWQGGPYRIVCRNPGTGGSLGEGSIAARARHRGGVVNVVPPGNCISEDVSSGGFGVKWL